MNSGNASFVAILRILLVLAVLGAALFLLLRVPKLVFKDPVAGGQPKCVKDDAYYYKDPHNHPFDC
ncbi:MAG: hypothetical protein IT260_22370 [Saprospiraceae bacterium]|nr:hypothetical protein [Saprospiraceae bacterium]